MGKDPEKVASGRKVMSGFRPIHYWSPVDFMSYSFVNFVTFLISTERKCHICDIIVLNKLALTQSKRSSDFNSVNQT